MKWFKEENESTRKCLKWWAGRSLIGLGLFWLILSFVMPLTLIMINRFSEGSAAFYGSYLLKILSGEIFLPLSDFGRWLITYAMNEPRHTTWLSFFAWKVPLVPAGFFVWYQLWVMSVNPYHLAPQTFGDGREALPKDIRKMGLYDGKYLMLGMFEGKKIKLPETKSVFCIGCPGSGKTMGVVVPAILELNNASLIINDPKGELARLTSGHRANQGPVFMMNWAGVDDKANGIKWPSWNPIGPGNLPDLHNGRESYIDDLIQYLIPDGPQGTDPYWVKSGRGCLTGITGYLCGKVEQAKANDYFLKRLEEGGLDDEDYAVLLSFYRSMRDFDEVKSAIRHAEEKTITKENYLPIGSWGHIPRMWQGHDVCFAMLLDLISNRQIKLNRELDERRRMGDITALGSDAWKIILEEAVLETAYYGYGRRTLLELNQVLSLPDKQRGSVVSMALSGINLFKNSAVRERTSMNDFTYSQLRGMRDPVTGEIKPVTIYLSVPYEDLGASLLLSTLFINMTTGHLMDAGPNEKGNGPYPMGFILDEFQHMPSLKSITDGIVFGRSKQNMFLVVVQDWHQISSRYDEETKNVILSSVAVKIVKRQNNIETRNALTNGIASITKIVHSYSYEQCKIDFTGSLFKPSKGAPFSLWHKVSHKIKTQPDSLIGGSGILSMAPTKQLVLYAGHLDRPIRATTPLCYSDKEYKVLTKLPPAPRMPDYVQHNSNEENVASDLQLEI